MASIPVPPSVQPGLARLWEDYRIEIPVGPWNDQLFVRISIQAYNTPTHVDRLVAALGEILQS